MIYIRDLIKKKRNKEELTEEEIDFFIHSYNKDEILKEQASALLMLMNVNGLTEKEMAMMVNSIVETGEKMDIFELSNQVLDIHPIGGVYDKITIMLLAIMNALGYPVIKVISREIGVKDKLVNTKIYSSLNHNNEAIKRSILNNEIILLEEPKNVAPVENKLYKLRNDIACNDDISIIAINLMSQKLALGFRKIIFDISYGEKAYVKTLSDAQKLAKYLIKIGSNLDRNVRCIITRLDEPIGKYFGNTIELQEALTCLNGSMSNDIEEMVFDMGSQILQMQNGKSIKENRNLIEESIKNKKAYNKLFKLIHESDDINYESTKKKTPVMSMVEGYVEEVDVSQIRVIARYIEAIRHSMDMPINYGTGLELCKKIGDYVEVGDILRLYIY